MSKKTNSAAHVAVTEIVRWLTSLAVSAVLLLGCVCLYNTATAKPQGDVFTGTAQGMFCEIQASITVSEGKIVDVTLTGADETPALGGKVLEEMPARIVEAQSADVDGMTGATVTTNAVKAAVKEAMTQAGLLPATPVGEEYTGTAQGMFCEIEAKVIVNDGKIVAVSLTGDAETPELGGKVLEMMPDRIVEAQSADVDGMTGATVTTNAVKDAVKQALTAAGLLEAAEPAEDDVAQGVEEAVVETEEPTEEATEATEEATEATEEEALVMDAAVYTGKAQGMGEVTAELIVADGHIVGVNLTGDGETPGIGSRAIEELPEKILEAQSADVDGVTGATVTSDAIKEAVRQAMTEAGLTAEAPADDEAALTVALEDAADGTYSATTQGFGGDIIVEVTLEGGKITDVKITGDDETAGVGAVAVEKMPAQFLEAQAMDVDGVTGATVSSNAIRKAFSDALAQAGVDASALVKQETQVYTGKAKGMFCEIVAEVTVKDGKIVDVKLTGADETPALGGKVLEMMPDRIVEAQSTDVDGMTGATVTTNAVKAAVNDALVQAGLKDAD